MPPIHRLSWAAFPMALAAGLALTGCGTPGAPQPPSLNLPDRVENLAATRTGNVVSLAWTMPKKNTDKVLLKGDVPVRVCRKEGAGECDAAGGDLLLAPGVNGAFSETLPVSLAAGPPRELSYFIELKNRNGRSAGLSNAAILLAGEAPAGVTGLAAEVRKEGVVLRWTSGSPAQQASQTGVRLHRKLLTPAAAKPARGPLAEPPEPVEQSLLVDSAASPDSALDHALDKEIRFGQTYEYRAQRVARVQLKGQTLELAGDLSAPVRVEAVDIFPPAVPTGLAAVATLGEAGTEAVIDLSWQPATDVDLAGYAVYRWDEGGKGGSAWQRISPAQPLVPPAFRDTLVKPGHSYRYAVSAIDQGGHESARSAEAQETVPTP